MGFLSDLIPRTETRAERYTSGGAELMLSKNMTASNQIVTERTALTVAAVHLAVRVIAETLGSLPIRIYQESTERKGKRLASENQADYLLHIKPNPFQTPMQFKEMMLGHCVLRGFGVARRVLNQSGKTIALIPIHPSSVEFGYRANNELYFKITHNYIDADGIEKSTVEVLFQQEVFFLMGMSLNHYPISPIRAHAETIGVALNTREYKASFFGNSAMPSGILKHPGFFRDDQEKEIERLRKEFREKFTGENRFTTMVLQHGMEWQQLGITNSDSELIKSEQFSVLEIARAFRIQPHKLMHLEDMGRANIEQMAIEHVADTLRPWAIRFEEAVNRDLISSKDRVKGFGAYFNFDALLRGDTAARHNAYATGRQWGYLSINDIREEENKTPLDPEIGDVYLSPVNMVNAAFAGREQEAAPEVQGESPLANRSAITEAILRPIIKKIVARQERNLTRAIEKGELETAHKKEIEIARAILDEAIQAIGLLIPDSESRYANLDFNDVFKLSEISEEAILSKLLTGLQP